MTILVDGKVRPRHNSLGEPIAHTNESLIRFWRWFGESRVVDAQGRPLVVYHGTAEEFAVFAGGRGGFYFTNDKKAANEYARNADGEGGPRVVEGYLSIRNPLVLDRAWYDQNVMLDGEPEWEVVDYTIHAAEEAGHDGLILRGFPDFDGMVYELGRKVGRRVQREYDQHVAFRPEQIKSVNNVGSWNPNDPRILDADAESFEENEEEGACAMRP